MFVGKIQLRCYHLSQLNIEYTAANEDQIGSSQCGHVPLFVPFLRVIEYPSHTKMSPILASSSPLLCPLTYIHWVCCLPVFLYIIMMASSSSAKPLQMFPSTCQLQNQKNQFKFAIWRKLCFFCMLHWKSYHW